MAIERLLLVEPRSFCAGVETAVKTLAWMVWIHDEPVYCVHEIVHNREVVDRFQRLGVVFVDTVTDVPADAPVVLSAHGSAPGVVTEARRRPVSVDAVCPLVAKVHREIRERARAGDTILYAGHRGHDEAVAALAIAPGTSTLIETPDEIELIPPTRAVSLLAQTTLNCDDVDAIERAARQRFAHVWTPRHADLCFATTNRQRALAAACDHAEAVVVVGSRSSSNTRALVDVARRGGRPVQRVDRAEELVGPWPRTVAVTAGASAPARAVDEVVNALGPVSRERFAPIPEDEYFPLPPDLRALLASRPLTELQRELMRRDRSLAAVELLEEVERESFSDKCDPAHALAPNG